MRAPIVLFGTALLVAGSAMIFGRVSAEEETETMKSGVGWSTHTVEELRRKRAASGRPYLEFLRVPGLDAGLYELAAGAVDRQQPHAHDEIYYVISGRGRLSVGADDVAAEPGSVLYVAAGVDHRFHSITEDLSLLVVFSGEGG